tara:strand:+ start:26 stop:559 length:534 start_codon:yes stop_codon:yes gene_type:complete
MSVSTVTSEALQLKLRQLLPSQQGFGTDLSASDTIIPIIDLTSAAEGSDVGQNLQTALAFNSITSFFNTDASTTIINGTGFYRIYGVSVVTATSGGAGSSSITMTDGSSNKNVFVHTCLFGSAQNTTTLPIDIVVYLRAGDSVIASANTPRAFISGTVRQIADNNGTLVQPSGFNPQ